MTTRSWIRQSFIPRDRPRTRGTRLTVEALEDRLAPTIDLYAAYGGTMDVNPISSIFPAGDYARMEVMATDIPGLDHGTMYRVSGTEAYPWGSGAPNFFAPRESPSFNQNRIFAGEGFRYISDGETGLNQTESVPVRFSNVTGTETVTDTLVIHIIPADEFPTITKQPEGPIQTNSGTPVTLSVEATDPTGSGELSYRWFRGLTPNASNPIGDWSASNTITVVEQAGGQHHYWVKVFNGVGVVNSLNVTVTLYETTKTVAKGPLKTLTYSNNPAYQFVPLEATVTRSVQETFGIADGGVIFTLPDIDSVSNEGFTHVLPGVVKVTAELTVAPGTHAGDYPLTVRYNGNVGLYLGGSSDTSQTLTILKADQSIGGFGALPEKTFGDADFEIKGVWATSGSEAGGVTFTSSNPSVATVSGTTVTTVGAGTAKIVASQAGNGDWNPAQDVEQTLVVNKATPTVFVGGTFTYDGKSHSATATATGADGDPVSGTLTITYNGSTTAPTAAGTYPVEATFTSDDPNYTDASATGTLVIKKATPKLTWADPAAIVYGTALSAAQLNATADVPGTFTYSPAAGTVLGAGTHTLAVTFTPDDAANYLSAAATVSLTVDRATPQVTWDDPAGIVYGTALGAAQLNATADVPGTFTYSPAAGTVLGAGSRTLSVTFTPDDATTYAIAIASAQVTVTRATLTVTADDAARAYGVANPAFSAKFSGFVNGETSADAAVTGSPSLTTDATAGSTPGTYTITAGAGDLAAANYDFDFIDGTLTVTPAPLSASGVNVRAAADARFDGVVARFTNADPFGDARSYTAVIAWGDGSTSAGRVTGTGATLTVRGAHTYDRPGTHPVSVTVSHDLGYTTSVTTDGTATVGPKQSPMPQTADPRTPFTISLRSFRPGVDPVRSWTINWGDGSTQEVQGNPRRIRHRYPLQTARYTITATVNYQDGTRTVNTVGVKMDFRDPLAAYVADTFDALTGGAVDEVRLRRWVHILQQATDPATLRTARSVVVRQMRTSAKYRARLVRSLFLQLLDRNPTRGELEWALSLFHSVPLLGSDVSDGGWSRVKPLILTRIT